MKKYVFFVFSITPQRWDSSVFSFHSLKQTNNIQSYSSFSTMLRGFMALSRLFSRHTRPSSLETHPLLLMNSFNCASPRCKNSDNRSFLMFWYEYVKISTISEGTKKIWTCVNTIFQSWVLQKSGGFILPIKMNVATTSFNRKPNEKEIAIITIMVYLHTAADGLSKAWDLVYIENFWYFIECAPENFEMACLKKLAKILYSLY